jgi:hypothetical protein
MLSNYLIRVLAPMTLVSLLAPIQFAHAFTVIGPSPTESTPYLSFADSPFNGLNFSSFFLENFEDGMLNTLGVSAVSSSGRRLAFFQPGLFSDSVDSDDGTIDGLGRNGRAFGEVGDGLIGGITFSFDAQALGRLPTHVGVVWTDSHSDSVPGLDREPLSIEAFDVLGNSLGDFGPFSVGDGRTDGTTSDDRFFGFIDSNGISAFSISQPNITVGFSLDHLQYGVLMSGDPEPVPEVPEPTTILAIGLMGVAIRKKYL